MSCLGKTYCSGKPFVAVENRNPTIIVEKPKQTFLRHLTSLHINYTLYEDLRLFRDVGFTSIVAVFTNGEVLCLQSIMVPM